MLEGKIVLVTGSSRGIGKATATLAAREGARVIVNYNKSREAAEALVQDLTSAGYDAYALRADVSKYEEVSAMFSAIRDRSGGLDVLVNNAGIVRDNLVQNVPLEDFDEVVGVNCKGPYMCLQQAAKIMIGQRSGKIINVSSIVGTNGNFGQTLYGATKAFVIGMTKSAAKELGRYGITVNAVAPGFTETDMMKGIPENIRERLLKNIPLRRFGQPEDVARVVVSLCSDAGNYISGQIIGVDGSMIL